MDIKTHLMTMTDEKLFENLVDCDEVMINHVIVPAGDGFAGHPTDSNVFIQIRRGEITLTFADGSSQDILDPKIDLISLRRRVAMVSRALPT